MTRRVCRSAPPVGGGEHAEEQRASAATSGSKELAPWLAALVLAVAFATPPLAAANVIQDSDMEQAGLTNWPHGDIAGTNSSAKAGDHFQSAVQSLKGTSQAGQRIDVDWFNSQSVGTIANPPAVTLSLWWGVQYNVTTVNAQGQLLFEIDDGGGWTPIWSLSINTPSLTFQSGTVSNFDVTADFAGATASYDVRVRFTGRTGRDNAATVNVWWDDVVLDVASAAATTTVGNGTDPGASSRCPGDGTADLDAFTLQTSTGTDTVTAVQVTFAAGTAVGLGLVEITSNDGATVYGSASNPADVQSIPLTTNIPVTTTLTPYRVRVTPKSDAAMPVPPGASYAVTGRVTDVTASNAKDLQDTGSGTVTIDNLSPSGATFTSCTPIDSSRIDVTWTNPGGDFSGVLVLRGPAGGACPTFAPVEGTSYGTGPQGADIIVHAAAGTSASDTGLSADTSYCYEVWAFDTCLNYFGGPPSSTSCATPPAGNTAPVVTITAPPDASAFTQGANISFTGTATDAEDGDLTAGLSWTSSIDGAIGTGGSFSRSDLSLGTHTITASVTDSGSLQGQDQITLTVNPPGNSAPVVTISSPTNGSSFTQGANITFTGTATDAEDGNLTASLSWTSSIDGAIGSGGSFARSDLSLGSHTITASVTDSGSLQGQDQITLTVVLPVQNDTVVTSNTASPNSCNQITASSFFAGDANDNGSTGVQFRTPPGGGAWTTACATLTGASPRECQVTGLAASTQYQLQFTVTDGDGLSCPSCTPCDTGTDCKTATTPACGGNGAPPTVLVLTPVRDAVLGGADKVKVQVWDADDANPTVQWSVNGGALSAATANPNYSCGTNCKVYEFDLDTVGLANGGHFFTVRATDAGANVGEVSWAFRVNNLGTLPGGAGLLLRRTPGSQICIDCHNLPNHSSQTTDTGYGNWAVACMDCHTPHLTENISLIRKEIRTPRSGKRAVRFEDNSIGAVANSSTPGSASFVNQDNATQADGPCQACHTRTGGATARWRNAASGGNAQSHYTVAAGTQPCTNCHTHATGFKGAGGCTDCHFAGGPAVDAGRRPVDVDFGRTSHHVGTGGAAMGGSLTNFDCVVCHAEGKVNAAGDDVETTGWHNDTGCNGGRPCIDLKNVDTWSDSSPAAAMVWSYDKQLLQDTIPAVGSWSSGNANWQTQTSTKLDPFCLTCHDSDGALLARNKNLTEGCTSDGDALNPFCDGAISNDYDRMVRNPGVFANGRVVDVASRVASAWSNGNPSGGGAYTATNRDQSVEARFAEKGCTQGCANPDPPQGIYSRHAIRGQSVSVYLNNTTAAARWVGNWLDNSVMGCADCHTTDGANGASGNAHGSPSEYLLKDAFGGATLGTHDNYNATAQTGGYVCWRCHARGTYVRGTHTPNNNDFNDSVGQVGTNRIANATPKSGFGNILGFACTSCHGGNLALTGNPATGSPQFGTIHGTSQLANMGPYDSKTGWAGVRQTYRFTNGNAGRWYNPEGWNGTEPTCYTLGSKGDGGADSFSGCTQHGGGTNGFGVRNRQLDY